MGATAITLLMLLGTAGFAWLAWRKLALVAAMGPTAPTSRLDMPSARWRSVLVNGLLQQRMLLREWRPGLMHAVIFLGFLALLLRKLQLIAIGYDEAASWPAAFGGPFAALKDAVEIAVLAAVGYALYRRYVLRPRRLEGNREALLVLTLIAIIMLSDIAFDALRFLQLGGSVPAVAHEREWAFAGAALAAAWSDGPAALQQAAYHASYWVQMVTVFSFLVLLPVGEHFHIVTALPALFLRRGRPANQVPPVDLDRLMAAEEEADMRAGARDVRELSWKDGLDAFTCTECGRCKDACPTFLTGKPLNAKAVNDSLKHHLLEQAPALRGGGELPALVPGVIAHETLWACTTCGYCEAACPIELEHLDEFFRLRQHQVMIEGEFPHELKKAFEAWESQGNAWGMPAQERDAWARGLHLPRVTSAADMAQLDHLFYVGSAMSYDPRGQKIARAFVQLMQRAGVRIGILGADEGSTGECARRLGNEMLFRQLAETLVATLNERGVKNIVTCDPHALNTLRNEFTALGGHYEVRHHSELLAELIAAGRLSLQPQAKSQPIVFHDPCYLGRHNGEYDAPRAVLQAATGRAPAEFALARESAMCCGAGGGRFWLEETIGTRIHVERAEQAVKALQAGASGVGGVATACPYCAVMLGDGLQAVPQGQEVVVRDIAEWLVDALPAVPAAATQERQEDHALTS